MLLKDIFEYKYFEQEPAPVDVEIGQLQTSIKQQVDNVGDVKILNKVASILRSGNIFNIARMAFNKDADSAKFINRLSEIIVGVEIPISDKVKFLREFGKKDYIKADGLFNGTGQVQSMDDWWTGTGFATTMFKLMINDPQLIGKEAGEAGPGEVAIACFHRKVTVGMGPATGYDLKYGGDLIEVKTKAAQSSGGGGRWTATNDYPLVAYLGEPNSLLDPEKVPGKVSALPTGRKVPGIANILNNPEYLKNPEQGPLTINKQKEIYKRLLQLAYSGASSDTIDSAVSVYPDITRQSIAPAAFSSYKAKQKFHSMLLIKVRGDLITTVHFKDLATAIDNFSLSTLYMSGEQRGMSMQATLR